MYNNNEYYIKKTELKSCQVCSKGIMLTKSGIGECEHCEWIHSEDAVHNYDIVRYPNIVPFSRAVELVKQGKKIQTRIEDFIGMYESYGEVGFVYNGQNYGLINSNGKQLAFYRYYDEDFDQQYFLTADDFINNANISGILLKNIWNEISEVNWLM